VEGKLLVATVWRKNEVSLFGNYYRILGAVQPSVASQWPQKVTFGDYTKDSEQIASTWNMSDWRGGIGVAHMKEGQDDDRCLWSTCQLDYKGHLVLPLQATDCGNDTEAECAILIEYKNRIYGVFGDSVRRWDDGASAWSASLVTLNGPATDAIVHNGKLYFACGVDIDRFDGTTWTDGLALSGAAQPCQFLVEWDNKLFTLDYTGQLDYTDDEGVTWTANALSNLPNNYYTSLCISRDAAGDRIIYLGTKIGLYALDYINAKWYKTGLSMPFNHNNCAGMTDWRDVLYVSSGMQVYRYIAGEEDIQVMGLDRDGGVPDNYFGVITKLISEHNALYALVDATDNVTKNLFNGGYLTDQQFYDPVGYSYLAKWSGQGWSVAHLSADSVTRITTATAAYADEAYRLWFALNKKVYYIGLPYTIQNPDEVPDATYALSSIHETPWFDADNDTSTKIGLGFSMELKNTANSIVGSVKTAIDYVLVWYETELSENWLEISPIDTSLADTANPERICEDGEIEFYVGSSTGRTFNRIRFRVQIVHATAGQTESVDIQWMRLKYIKLLEPKWGFKVRIDCSRNYRHKSAASLLDALKDALETQTLGAFQFKDASTVLGRSESHNVRIVDMRGAEIGGKVSEGIFDLTLIAP